MIVVTIALGLVLWFLIVLGVLAFVGFCADTMRDSLRGRR